MEENDSEAPQKFKASDSSSGGPLVEGLAAGEAPEFFNQGARSILPRSPLTTARAPPRARSDLRRVLWWLLEVFLIGLVLVALVLLLAFCLRRDLFLRLESRLVGNGQRLDELVPAQP
jgi:hypothetical protein